MNNLLLEVKFKDEKLKPLWLKTDPKILFKEIKEIDGKVLVFGTDKAGREFPLITKKKKIEYAFSIEEQLKFLLNQEYVQKGRPLISYLPFHYHKIPFRILINKILLMVKSGKKYEFPNWPADVSVDILVHIEKTLKKQKPFSWPKGKKYAVVFSHDIDTTEGLSVVQSFLELEKKYNIHSTNFIVSNYYPLKEEQLLPIIKAGHELGCHGDNHDALLPFLFKNQIENRLD